MSPGERWPGGEHEFRAESLDAFLVWAAERGASDVSFQTGLPAFVEIDGVLVRATGAVLDDTALEWMVQRIFGDTGDGVLRSGKGIDCSHTVARGRGDAIRFRCNLAPVQVGFGFGINVTLRILPGDPPEMEALGVEPEIAAAWDLCRGLTLVTGVPGSGKSTLLAAGTRRLLERGVGRIQSYEAPIEFVFDGVAADGAMMSSSEIPRHFPSFAEGLRSSLRRRPTAVIVGEARDRETVEAVVRAADFGIAVFATAHTIGVAATVRRMVSEFPAEERTERGAALIDALNLVVTQVLVPDPAGGRTAVREWLVFDRALKAALLDLPQRAWPARIGQALEAAGHDLRSQALRAHAAGRIGEADARRLLAGSAPPVPGAEHRAA